MRSAWRLLPAVGLLGLACQTDAVGISDCRQIEEARCQAASHCPALHVDDVDACKRFYRDQCLHGLAVADSPGAPIVDGCVGIIRAAGECAAVDPARAPAACDSPLPPADRISTLPDVCAIVQFPERTAECSFLADTTTPVGEPTAGAAGQTAAATGGSGGTGAAAGSGGAAG